MRNIINNNNNFTHLNERTKRNVLEDIKLNNNGDIRNALNNLYLA